MKNPVEIQISEALATRLDGSTLKRQMISGMSIAAWASGLVTVEKKRDGIYVVSIQYPGKKSYLSQEDVKQIVFEKGSPVIRF